MPNLNFSDLFEGTRKEKIDNIIKYVQQNIASVSIMLTAFISIGSIVIKIIHYLTEFGYVTYLGIPPSAISINSDNLIYEFFTSGIFALLLFLLNLIPFYIWKSDKKIIIKILLSFLLFISPVIPATIIVLIVSLNGFSNMWFVIFEVAILCLLLGLLVFSYGTLAGILSSFFESKAKKKDTATEKDKIRKQVFSTKFQIVIYMIIFLVVESLVCMLTGYFRAKNRTDFKIVENYNKKNYAIIYETKDTYFLSECSIECDKIKSIDFSTKLYVNKEDVDGIQKILTKI